MASNSPRERLPFEPKGSDKAVQKRSGGAVSAAIPQAVKSSTAKSTAIPEVVSRRMLRRMAVFSGIPTLAGVLTFFVSYVLIINDVVELPSYFVLLTTLGCFGLGVVGLTYGVLSASWDESRTGSLLGVEEFTLNLGRMTSAWRSKAGN
ncbi:MAG: PAM68 family protein [Nodosilinea sp.]